jgi:hypothetical protein
MLKRHLRWVLAAAILASLVSLAPRLGAADALPSRLSDAAYWKLIEDSSEDSGVFQSENFLSNETGLQVVIPRLKQLAEPDGVYLGVGPEQNFTYIAAIQPKMAFIVDIRRQNMLEHMIYKALFEMSPDRVEFLSRLFSRKRPADLDRTSTVDELFTAFRVMPVDNDAFVKSLHDIMELLLKTHGFALTSDDQDGIEHVFMAFREFGPDINYNSALGRGRFGRAGGMPNYAELMTATDRQGEKRSYLATEANYQAIRELEGKNLLVPLTGDFGGKKALRTVAQYLKDHEAVVTTFYLSNVERYLFLRGPNQNGGWESFYENVAAMPLSASSTFIRSVSGNTLGLQGMRAPNVLASMQETLAAVKDGRIRTYNDVFDFSR